MRARRSIPFAGASLSSIILFACQAATGPSAEALAQTLVAGTGQANISTPISSSTPLPTFTPVPATETPSPSATQTEPAGPTSFVDGFSADTGHWDECRGCKWEGDTLLMGPYAPSMSPEGRLAVCLPCGSPTYFRVSV